MNRQKRAKKPSLSLLGGGNTARQGTPELQSSDESDWKGEAIQTGRGVFEITESIPNIRTFHICMKGNVWVRTVTEPADRVTPESIGDLWRYLDELDPIVERSRMSLKR